MKSQGLGVNEDVSFTVNSVDVHAVCYGIDHVVTGGGNCTAQGKCWYEEVCPTLKGAGVHAICKVNKEDEECLKK